MGTGEAGAGRTAVTVSMTEGGTSICVREGEGGEMTVTVSMTGGTSTSVKDGETNGGGIIVAVSISGGISPVTEGEMKGGGGSNVAVSISGGAGVTSTGGGPPLGESEAEGMTKPVEEADKDRITAVRLGGYHERRTKRFTSSRRKAWPGFEEANQGLLVLTTELARTTARRDAMDVLFHTLEWRNWRVNAHILNRKRSDLNRCILIGNFTWKK